jgi:hypothetical protein
MPSKDTIKAIKRVSREQNKLPKAKVISPNKKAYTRKEKHKTKATVG